MKKATFLPMVLLYKWSMPICDNTSVSDTDLLDDTVFLDFSVSDSEKMAILRQPGKWPIANFMKDRLYV